MSATLGIICVVIGILATGIAFARPAPGKARLRIRLFVLGPVLAAVGVLVITGVIGG